MANKKSALKAHRQSIKRAARNRAIRSSIRTYFKTASTAIAERTETVAASVREAVSQLDRAARKGVIHPNAAARRKSRLMSRLHLLSTTPVESAAPPAAKPARGGARPATKATASRATGRATAARKPAAPRKAAAK